MWLLGNKVCVGGKHQDDHAYMYHAFMHPSLSFPPLRTAFLAFCNHSEARKLFVYLSSKDEGEGGITVSATPPRQLSDKALFFLKCSHASKLSRESIGQDVVYSECSTLPLGEQKLPRYEMPLYAIYMSCIGGVFIIYKIIVHKTYKVASLLYRAS